MPRRPPRRRAAPLLARGRLPEHRDLRPAAAHRVRALAAAPDEWRHGRTGFDGWDRSVGAARQRSRGSRACAGDVAIGSAVSAFAGLVAAALPDGARVLCAEGDFTSVLFPFLAQERRGVTVELVAARAAAPRRSARSTTLVAVSAVQSADGRLADLDALARPPPRPRRAHVRRHTQAMGWLPLDCARFDYTACAAYKWLLSPRGTAFFTIRPGAARRAHAARGRLVRGRGRAGVLLRRAAAAGRATRAASTSRPRG